MPVQVDGMTVTRTDIDGLACLRPKSVTDERGTIREVFRSSSFADARLAVPERWSQINLTWSRQGAIRGLHGEAMTKLIGVVAGEAFGAYVDVRPDSASFGRVVTMTLSVGVQLLVPPGVCNGFQATSAGGCQYLYCFDAEWSPGLPGVALTPLDAELAIDWPLAIDAEDSSQLSRKDAGAPTFATLRTNLLG